MNPRPAPAYRNAPANTEIGRLPSGRIRACAMLLLALAPFIPAAARAQGAPAPYPERAPIDQYLIADRDAEIALARSAAPEAISRDATVLVLGRKGYETAFEGKNGFTCLVERGWMSPFDSSDFWNPKIRGPICYNPAAVRSVLPYTLYRTKLVLDGAEKTQMHASIVAAVAKGELAQPEAVRCPI